MPRANRYIADGRIYHLMRMNDRFLTISVESGKEQEPPDHE